MKFSRSSPQNVLTKIEFNTSCLAVDVCCFFSVWPDTCILLQKLNARKFADFNSRWELYLTQLPPLILSCRISIKNCNDTIGNPSSNKTFQKFDKFISSTCRFSAKVKKSKVVSKVRI